MSVVFSGVQPTGSLHLGNFLGAIKRFAELQTEHDCLFCVVDLHALTVDYDPKTLAENCRAIAAAYVACGIDPKVTAVFRQSRVPAHAELGQLLLNVARMGEMERMTQFKSKSGDNQERASIGLFTYPILMAADIMAYRATLVPVGDDQVQHLQLANDLSRRFNHRFGVNMFREIKPLIDPQAKRIMSLTDGTKKMSKSDPDDMSRINLSDDNDTIARKIKKATAYTDPISPSTVEASPEVANLLTIYEALTGQQGLSTALEGVGYGKFKPMLTEALVAEIGPIRDRMAELMAAPDEVDRFLQFGANGADILSSDVMNDVRAVMGLA